jgi:hypothetical protein
MHDQPASITEVEETLALAPPSAIERAELQQVDDRRKRNKIKYRCPQFGLNLWGKPDAPAACWDCRQPMPRTK